MACTRRYILATIDATCTRLQDPLVRRLSSSISSSSSSQWMFRSFSRWLTFVHVRSHSYSHWRTAEDRAVALAQAPAPATLDIEVCERTKNTEAKAVVCMVTEEQCKNNTLGTDGVAGLQSALKLNKAQQEDFKGKAGSKLMIYTSSGTYERVLLVGIGEQDKVTIKGFRVAIHEAITTLKETKNEKVAIIMPTIRLEHAHNKTAATADEVLDVAARVAMLSNAHWDKYLKKDDDDAETGATPSSTEIKYGRHHVSLLYLLTTGSVGDLQQQIIRRAQIITDGTILARELGNDRADFVNPAYMEKVARALGHTWGLKVYVAQHDELKKKGYNLITAVGQAAPEKARIITIEYNGGVPGSKPIALVGKGITYDTGGLNLKPTGSMETMYMDMCGSAAVLSTMKVLAQLKSKVNVVGVLAMAENAIDGHSLHPGDIIKTLKHSVHIGNTDAEGRLALSDAVMWVQNHHKPESVTTIATLTGAIIIALGHHCAGFYSTDDRIAQQFLEAGDRVHERVWRLPLWDEYAEVLKGEALGADLNNIGGTRDSGSIVAAHFIKKFVDEGVHFSHIDVAGTAMLPKAIQYNPQGATGFGVQLFTDFVEAHAQTL